MLRDDQEVAAKQMNDLAGRQDAREPRSLFGGAGTMTPATKALHTTIIRLLKGILGAWERWLKQQQEDERA